VVIEVTNFMQFGSPACVGGQTGDAAVFELLTNCPGATWNGTYAQEGQLVLIQTDSPNNYIEALANFSNPPVPDSAIAMGSGGFQSVLAPMPEPSALVLAVLGLGWLTLKRLAR
jgi:hypothetical protein